MASSNKSALFSPLTIRGVTFKNRIGVAPMSMFVAEDGFGNDYHLVYYGDFAIGGAGLIIVESTAVEERGRGTTGDLGIWKDEHVEPLTRISKFVKDQGCVPGIQLSHSGRKGSAQNPFSGRCAIKSKEGAWPTIGPSAVAFGGAYTQVPKAATIEDIQQIKEAFTKSAQRAVQAGFDVLELHYAHGYLISSFLSTISNQRTDHYGGSLENRMRLAIETATEVRKVIPEATVLAVRVSVTDYCENGWTVDDTVELVKRLKTVGVDLVDCSSGGVAPISNMREINSGLVQRDAARRVQKESEVATCAVGEIRDPLQAERILASGGATIVLLGRMFLNNPHWVFHAADLVDSARSFEYPAQFDWCIGWRAYEKWRILLYQKQRKHSIIIQ